MVKKSILHTSTLEEEDFYKNLSEEEQFTINFALNDINKYIFNILTDKGQKIEVIRDSFDVIFNSGRFISGKDGTRLIRYIEGSDDFGKELYKYIESESKIGKGEIALKFLGEISTGRLYNGFSKNDMTGFGKGAKDLGDKILDHNNKNIDPDFKKSLINYILRKTARDNSEYRDDV